MALCYPTDTMMFKLPGPLYHNSMEKIEAHTNAVIKQLTVSGWYRISGTQASLALAHSILDDMQSTGVFGTPAKTHLEMNDDTADDQETSQVDNSAMMTPRLALVPHTELSNTESTEIDTEKTPSKNDDRLDRGITSKIANQHGETLSSTNILISSATETHIVSEKSKSLSNETTKSSLSENDSVFNVDNVTCLVSETVLETLDDIPAAFPQKKRKNSRASKRLSMSLVSMLNSTGSRMDNCLEAPDAVKRAIVSCLESEEDAAVELDESVILVDNDEDELNLDASQIVISDDEDDDNDITVIEINDTVIEVEINNNEIDSDLDDGGDESLLFVAEMAANDLMNTGAMDNLNCSKNSGNLRNELVSVSSESSDLMNTGATDNLNCSKNSGTFRDGLGSGNNLLPETNSTLKDGESRTDHEIISDEITSVSSESSESLSKSVPSTNVSGERPSASVDKNSGNMLLPETKSPLKDDKSLTDHGTRPDESASAVSNLSSEPVHVSASGSSTKVSSQPPTIAKVLPTRLTSLQLEASENNSVSNFESSSDNSAASESESSINKSLPDSGKTSAENRSIMNSDRLILTDSNFSADANSLSTNDRSLTIGCKSAAETKSLTTNNGSLVSVCESSADTNSFTRLESLPGVTQPLSTSEKSSNNSDLSMSQTITIPAGNELKSKNSQTITIPAGNELKSKNSQTITIPAGNELKSKNSQTITIPAGNELKSKNSQTITIPAGNELKSKNSQTVTIPAGNELKSKNSQTITIPAGNELTSKNNLPKPDVPDKSEGELSSSDDEDVVIVTKSIRKTKPVYVIPYRRNEVIDLDREKKERRICVKRTRSRSCRTNIMDKELPQRYRSPYTNKPKKSRWDDEPKKSRFDDDAEEKENRKRKQASSIHRNNKYSKLFEDEDLRSPEVNESRTYTPETRRKNYVRSPITPYLRGSSRRRELRYIVIDGSNVAMR